MKTELLLGEELAIMQQQKDSICVSVIVPTHKLSPERRVDTLEVEKAVNKAKEYLQHTYEEEQVRPLLLSLDRLYSQIDFTRNAEGLGLFVSDHIQQLVLFHFPVREKVMVSQGFETRDWLYQIYYSKPYYVLLLTEQDAKLFEGKMNTLEEVNDHNFPLKYEDSYEYTRPSRGSSYVGHAFTKEFERDKSQMEEIRYAQFTRQVDEALNTYLLHEVPLIVVGTRKDVAAFKAQSTQVTIAGEIYGNNLYTPLQELAEASWDAYRFYRNRQKQQLITDFTEKIGGGLGIYGLRDCWKAAKEGRALTLLVEKDFTIHGYLAKEDPFLLYLRPPLETYDILPDAVNTLMEDVVARGGNVVLVENDALFDYQRLAVITRY